MRWSARIAGRARFLLTLLLVAIALPIGSAAAQSGIIIVGEAGTQVTTGGIVILQHPVIEDHEGVGVLHVVGDDLTLDFRGAMLRGANHATRPDAYRGIGIRVTGRNVTLRNLALSGFHTAIHAESADGLRIEHADLTDNFRTRLRSSFYYEDDADQLDVLPGESGDWVRRYGAGIAVISASDIVLRDVRVRDGQNGIVLDHVSGASIFDNDCSFLSGWGIALHRCEKIRISRNRLDFCVRGFSNGSYAHGYGSAGILLVDAGAEIVIVENSATHCGYGILDIRDDAAPPAALRIERNDFSSAVRSPLSLNIPASQAIAAAGAVTGAPAAQAASEPHLLADNRLTEAQPKIEFTGDREEDLGSGAALAGRIDPGGREAIRMTGWGPWDLVSIRLAEESGLLNFDSYRVLGINPNETPVTEVIEVLDSPVSLARGMTADQIRISVTREQAGVLTEYHLAVLGGPYFAQESASLFAEAWSGMLFDSPHDPVTEYEAWRSDAPLRGVAISPRRIDFPIFRTPLSDHGRRFAAIIRDMPATVERFGMLFETRARIPAGTWRVTVIGDDGFRLRIDGETVIDEWQPRDRLHRASHKFHVERERLHHLELDYFQSSGNALLRLHWEAAER